MTQTELTLIHQVRAFVMNPELIVLHMPLRAYSDFGDAKILQVLRAHVDERGIHLPHNERPHRRPRTLIYTAYGVNCDDKIVPDSVLRMQPVNDRAPYPCRMIQEELPQK